MLYLQTRIMKLLISFLDLKFVHTPQCHISMDWKLHSLPTYALKFAHATLQFLGSRGDGSLEWWMHFISIIILTISVLMATYAHKTTYAQSGKY